MLEATHERGLPRKTIMKNIKTGDLLQTIYIRTGQTERTPHRATRTRASTVPAMTIRKVAV